MTNHNKKAPPGQANLTGRFVKRESPMSLSEMPDTRQPYAHVWRLAHDAGYAPLPLPAGAKHPPPSGFTGGNATPADPAQLEKWESSSKCQNANIAFWLGKPEVVGNAEYQLVGIDVDHYAEKRGGDQLESLENKLGPLSDRQPWISSARTDGISGIRWFLAPLKDAQNQKIEFRGKADSAIDVIQGKHRYAVVWPSVVEDRVYWWFPPGVGPTDDGKRGSAAWREDDGLPAIPTFPVLSNSWVTYLRNHRSHSGKIDLKVSVTELERWADQIFNDGQASEMCWNIALALSTFRRKITDDESSHDKITDAHWLLYSLAAEGHTGWKDAVAEIESYWLNTVGNAGKRALSEARAEIFRSYTGALRKIKVRVDADGVKDQCDCAGIGSNLWHSDKVPLGAARQFALANERDDTPIKRWRDDWYQYHGTLWKRLDKDKFAKTFYDRLDAATYLNKDGIPIPWNPTDRKIATVEHALRSVVLLDSDDVDAPCWLDGRKDRVIAFRNTLLRIEDRKQFDHTPAYFNVNVLPFDYDPLAAEPNRWLQFLQEVWPDDSESIALLQEWFGYVLSGRTNLHKMLTLLGPRRSGKSTIAHILHSLVGADNQTAVRSADIVSQFGMAGLIGRTLATFDDDRITGSGKKFVDILKNIIGEGKVSIPRKYQDDWRGSLLVRFMYIANELSAMPDSSGAIIERMLVLETRNRFEENPDRELREKLEAELSGIFIWALDGLDRLNAQGRFTEPASSRQLIAELYDAASPITEFIGEACELSDDGAVPRDVLYQRWKAWCEHNGYLSGSLRHFLAQLRAAFGERIADRQIGQRGARQRSIAGLRLRVSASDQNVIPFRATPVSEREARP